jgi:hypothetical protein
LSAIRANLRKGWTQLTIISLFTLIALFYQLYLQRRHNEKSITPLGQILLGDHDGKIFVRIANNGIGPLIIDRISFIKDQKHYSNIEDCLTLDPKSYLHDIALDDSLKKVVLQGSYLEVFSTSFEEHDGEIDRENVRKQLSDLSIKADCRDIYNNKIIIKRDFKWFARHVSKEN